MDEPVWKNSMCNELGHLSQGWKKHTGNDKIYLILQKEKPKYRRITYVRSVCDIITQKKETRRTRISTGVNIIDYTG